MNALIEPFFYCLIASMIWAPIVFFAAAKLHEGDAAALAGKVWPVALMIAALPAMIAPFAAAFGLSLRSAQPLPPMAAIESPVVYATAPIETAAAPSTIALASVLEAAAVLYFYGFLMFLVLGLGRHIWFAYRVRFAFDLDEPALESALDDWRRQIGLKRRPHYAFSNIVSSVCVHGFFRPVILMPYNLLDRVSVKDAGLMGAHEMAHIKRGDTALFAFCTGVKAIFWFNPFTQRIAARATLAAEQAADALVISSGADRLRYAECFMQGLRFAAGEKFPGRELVPSFTPFDRRSRRERLDAILSGAGPASFLSLPGKVGLALSVILAAGLAFAQAALAVAPRPAEDALPQAPVKGDVTMGFHETSKLLGKERAYHEGIDIKAARGAVVRAAGDGRVIDATKRYNGQPAWGNVVVIDHGHGLVTRYAHLDSFIVRKGDSVKAGDTIGAVGSTGKTTGPHLHFEVIQDGLAIDPSPVIAAAPMAAPKPVSAPKPAAKVSRTRAVMIAPAPEPVAAPAPAPEPDDPAVAPTPPDADLEARLAGRLSALNERLHERFKNFDVAVDLDFDDFAVALDDLEIDGFPKAEEFTERLSDQLSDMEFAFSGMEDFDVAIIDDGEVKGFRFFSKDMSEKDRKKLRKEHKKAMERAEARAKRNAERAERNHERAEARAERTVERAERNRERAEARAEREREQAESEWGQRFGQDNAGIDERALLEFQQKALTEAKSDLEQQLAEIERRRTELDRKAGKTKSK